jgi:hypothetical protein
MHFFMNLEPLFQIHHAPLACSVLLLPARRATELQCSFFLDPAKQMAVGMSAQLLARD